MTERESSNHNAREYVRWSARDVALAAQAYNWPRVPFRGATIAGADAWEAALASADPDEREQLRAALPDEDDDA